MIATASTVLLLAALLGADVPADFTLPDAPGPFVGDAATEDELLGSNFKAGDPVVATSYFYWYDNDSKGHVLDHDGSDALTDHPPTLEGFSYKNPDWHAQQLNDMIDAGVDVALPVYWGTPVVHNDWPNLGLPPLVAARQRLLGEGKTPPAIGMFYDTSTLRYNSRGYHVDLTTPSGRLWFYGSIRDCFSRIPAKHRATIDGRPLVLLYASAFAAAVDENLFPAVRKMFREDFGTDLFLVKMRGWPGEADSEYQWGGALAAKLLDTAAIGPGYDHSAVPGRTPLVREREDGRFYTFGWERLLMMNPQTRAWLVHVETWNEFHEGTEVCETTEYGRQYIDLTRHFADRFHAGEKIDLSSVRPARPVISCQPGRSEGLEIVPQSSGDGPVVEKTVAGRKAWSTAPNQHSTVNRYLYFEVEDYFLFDGDEPVEVTVGYFDAGPGGFTFEYDSADPELKGLPRNFRSGHHQPIQGTGEWREVTFVVPHARFAGGSNNCDFRLAAGREDLVISYVSIRRPKGR